MAAFTDEDPIVPSDVVQAIQDSVKTAIIKVGDREYVTRPVFESPKESVSSPVQVNTLQGIVDYLKSNLDSEMMKGVAVHIAAPNKVSVLSGLFGDYQQREWYAIADLQTLFSGEFRFANYLDCETFIIGIRTLFEQTDTAEQVIKLVGNLTQTSEHNNADDGFTQKVTVWTGVSSVGNAVVQNPVTLIPFRTFREVAQPSSPFILRLTGGDKPKAALFEADGGQWKLEAIKNIKTFFEGKELGIPIIC